MTSILAIKYPTSVDRNNSNNNLTKKITVIDNNFVKYHIGQLLFNIDKSQNYNYCLIRFDNKLYVVEPKDTHTQHNIYTYTRTQISYHPLANQLN